MTDKKAEALENLSDVSAALIQRTLEGNISTFQVASSLFSVIGSVISVLEEVSEMPDEVPEEEVPEEVVFGSGDDEEWTFIQRVESITSNITYKGDGWKLFVSVDKLDPQGRVYMQVHHWRPDVVSGAFSWGKGGKLYLSEHMTESEIVRKAFQLFMAYEEHECREWFKYYEGAVFGPHIDVAALLKVSEELDVR